MSKQSTPSSPSSPRSGELARPSKSVFPLWLKLLYTAFIGLLVPVYLREYGPTNFLWLSDIGLIGGCIAMWMDRPRLAGTMALCVVIPDLMWTIDFVVTYFTHETLFGLSRYMFDDGRPKLSRGISLFHVVLPPGLVWMVARMGYDKRSLRDAIILTTIVFTVSYFISTPANNINWVLGPGGGGPQAKVPPVAYLAMLIVAFPLFVHFPTHALLTLWERRRARRGNRVA